MRRWWPLLVLIVFANLEPGVYLGTCDGVPIQAEVGADGTLGVECQSVALVRTTGEGITVQCEVVEEGR